MSNSLPHKSVVLRFSPAIQVPAGEEEESYQLLELPAEILKQVEVMKDRNENEIFPLTIKGRPSDDATLHTSSSTFLLRTIGISNSLLVCLPSTPVDPSCTLSKHDEGRDTLHIRDICHQVLECVPIAANLERIRTVLRASAWEGIGVSLGKRKRDGDGGKRTKRWTKEQLRSVVQASDAELDRGLKERNVVEVDGRLLLLPPAHLKELLTILLSLLTLYSDKSPRTAPVDSIISDLTQYDVPPLLATSVLGLFGDLEDNTWIPDAERIVKEVGLGLLCKVKKNKRQNEFIEKWEEEVGEEWSKYVDLDMLEGEYLLSPPPPSALSFASNSPMITYFPRSSLPLNPSIRFSELFLTRQRWRPEEMAPFLKGLVRDGDLKERDKIVAKFVRVVKEKDGVWWYPRRT